MKFYKIEIQTANDGTEATLPMVQYSTSGEAHDAWHIACASNGAAVKAGTIKAALVMVISSTGATTDIEYINGIEPAEAD